MKLIHSTPSQAEVKLPRASIEAIPRRVAEVERDAEIAVAVALRELTARGININPQLNTPPENKVVEVKLKQVIDSMVPVSSNDSVEAEKMAIADLVNNQHTVQVSEYQEPPKQEIRDTTDNDGGILDIDNIRKLIQDSLDEEEAA